MKKFIYILLLAFSTSLAVTGCTEENISPANSATKTSGSGGGGTTGQI